jgi:hypothetical protein
MDRSRRMLLLVAAAVLMFLPATLPGPVQSTACSATLECACGGGTVEINCVGVVSCMRHARSVVCDGVTTQCPPFGSCPP